jgi:pyridoxine 5'-phosphate synthase PdxJ
MKKLKEFKVLISVFAKDSEDMQIKVSKLKGFNELEWWCGKYEE